MISYLNGTLTDIANQQITLECQGVGYEVNIPKNYLSELPSLGSNLKVETYLQIRDDAHVLYGFKNKSQKKAFLLLLSVSGVGPKSAMTIISEVSVERLIKNILSENLSELSSVKGIGRKTAERVILELKEKIATAFDVENSDSFTCNGGSRPAATGDHFDSLEEAQAAHYDVYSPSSRYPGCRV
jgi:Holliday junction DNA helicase RuvA